jgi:hypothetical protein
LLGAGSAPVNIARVCSIILMKALAYNNLVDASKGRDHANRHAADIIRLSGYLVDADRIQVSVELYAPLEKLFTRKDMAFAADRVAAIRGAGVGAERVVADIQRFVMRLA